MVQLALAKGIAMSEVNKQCTGCGETKALTEFYKDKSKSCGLASHCKVCKNAYLAKWRADNPEYAAKWRADNPEYHAEYYAENTEREKARFAKYAKDNPDKFRAYKQRRRARKANAQGTFNADDWKAKLAYYGYRCRYCGIHKSETNEGWLEADHAIPLSQGGTNFISNIVPACKSCNCSKGTKTFKEFLNIE